MSSLEQHEAAVFSRHAAFSDKGILAPLNRAGEVPHMQEGIYTGCLTLPLAPQTLRMSWDAHPKLVSRSPVLLDLKF